jgi:hypothetical protein
MVGQCCGVLNDAMGELVRAHIASYRKVFKDLDVAVSDDHLPPIPDCIGVARRRLLQSARRPIAQIYRNYLQPRHRSEWSPILTFLGC